MKHRKPDSHLSTIRRAPTLAALLLLSLGWTLLGCASQSAPKTADGLSSPESPPTTLRREQPRLYEPEPGRLQEALAKAKKVPAPMLEPERLRLAEHDTEAYDHISENRFVSPLDQALSTFSIDVDTAAYANVRRFLQQEHRLPPADAVRIEELLNYFSYDYEEPQGEHPFAIATEISRAPWNPDHRLVHVGVQGRRINARDLPPSNLVFLIDVSGSMNQPNKLPLLQMAFRLLVENLGAQDSVAIVVYAGAAGLVLPPTPGEQKEVILRAIDSLRAGGSTAGGEGIRLAYEVARQNFLEGGNNRVLLATDGDFNVGASSDGEMVRLIESERRSGVYLSVLGFGTGNYQDSKMEKLADHGNGNAAYIDSLLEAKKVLVSEMGGTLFTIAQDVKIQVEFNPAVVKGYRLIGYENRRLAAADFQDDTKDAGELGAGHSVTALYDVILTDSEEPVATAGDLRYTDQTADHSNSNEMMLLKLRYKRPGEPTSHLLEMPVANSDLPLGATSDDFRFSAAVAELGLLLRQSQHRYDSSFASAIRLASGALGADREGYRRDFVRLAETAQLLAQGTEASGP